jgi:hypothetical protein
MAEWKARAEADGDPPADEVEKLHVSKVGDRYALHGEFDSTKAAKANGNGKRNSPLTASNEPATRPASSGKTSSPSTPTRHRWRPHPNPHTKPPLWPPRRPCRPTGQARPHPDPVRPPASRPADPSSPTNRHRPTRNDSEIDPMRRRPPTGPIECAQMVVIPARRQSEDHKQSRAIGEAEPPSPTAARTGSRPYPRLGLFRGRRCRETSLFAFLRQANSFGAGAIDPTRG